MNVNVEKRIQWRNKKKNILNWDYYFNFHFNEIFQFIKMKNKNEEFMLDWHYIYTKGVDGRIKKKKRSIKIPSLANYYQSI